MHFDRMAYGERIKRLRTGRELTQEQLAEKINVSRTYIVKIENGLQIRRFVMTKEMMEEKLYQRMQEENRQFLAELREQTADDIIAHAYEIACRDNFLMIFEDETGLTPQQLNALLRFEHPLAELYDDWVKRETSEMDNFRSSIECCANDAIRREKERKAQKKDAPER